MEAPCDSVCESLTSDEHKTLLEVWAALELQLPAILVQLSRPLNDAGACSPTEASQPVASNSESPALEALRVGLEGDFGTWQTLIRQRGTDWATRGVPTRHWCVRIGEARRELMSRLVVIYAGDPARLCRSLEAVERLGDCALAWLHDEYSRVREADVSALQDKDRQALLLSQRRFNRLAEAGIIGILVCDIYGNIKDANDAFLAMVGYTHHELVFGTIRWSEMTPPEWAHLDQRAIEQLQARGVTRTWEKEYFHKNGSRVPILVGVAMLNDTECIAFVLDLTERRRMDVLKQRSAELEAQNIRILESSRLQHEFLANMSHELRTPLNSIIGFADILFDGEVKPESPKHREFLGYILKSGRHLLQVINDVLDLAKVEAGKLEFRPEVVDVQHVFAEVDSVLRTSAESRQICMSVVVDPELGEVTLDQSRLKQVLYNYASNALKFTSEGGKVTLSARAEGPHSLRIEVEDTGIGIADADIGRLFVQFQQLDSGTTKHQPGTGLGLALTKRIVEAQGGSVGVKSVLGCGSVFYAILPRHVACVLEQDEEPTPLGINEHGTPVLVVEDNARDRAILVHLLTQAGYQVETASTGAQALAATTARKFAAVTLDLLLPDMTGLDVLHQIRLDATNRETPIIVVSVLSDQGMVAGFAVHDYVRKPANSGELLQSLERAGITPHQSAPILVVDDDPSARELMRALIEHRGFRAECCADGETALSAVRAHKPSAIILDLLMPNVDGFEFLLRFREQPENADIPVVVWTMKDLSHEDHARLRGMAQGVIAKCQAKPMALLEQIRDLLSKRSPARAALSVSAIEKEIA